MGEFFADMSSIEMVFWITALIGSTIFIILFVLSFIGADSETNNDIEINEGIGVQFFSVKNTMAFFTIFGWIGIYCLNRGFSVGSSFAMAFIAGFAMMIIMAFLFLWISKLSESGTLNIDNAVGNIGQVNLPIGANRSRIGKISIVVQGSKRELSALSDEKEELKQGESIKVTDVMNGEILLVERLTN